MYNSVTIIVCFYNAHDRIGDTLEHIKRLKTDSYTVELILVNNNSSDTSIKVIESSMNGFDQFPWFIVSEDTPGLTHARLKGISASKSEVLLFCDDDNWLKEDYILIGMQRLNNQRTIGILGGLGEAVSTIKIPSWFKENQNFYAVGPQFPTAGVVRGVRNVVYGAGMFMVKSCFEKITAVGFKPISSDRRGNQLSSGGDSELCLAFQIAGYQIYYDDKLRFKHFIEEKRLIPDYLKRLKKGMSESRFVTRFYLDYLNGYRPKITRLFWIKELIYALFTLENFRSSGLKRNSVFIKFLVAQRFKYNQQVDAIIQTCNSLSSLA